MATAARILRCICWLPYPPVSRVPAKAAPLAANSGRRDDRPLPAGHIRLSSRYGEAIANSMQKGQRHMTPYWLTFARTGRRVAELMVALRELTVRVQLQHALSHTQNAIGQRVPNWSTYARPWCERRRAYTLQTVAGAAAFGFRRPSTVCVGLTAWWRGSSWLTGRSTLRCGWYQRHGRRVY